MNLLDSFKNKDNYISPLNNPFKNDSIKGVGLFVTKNNFNEGFRFWGNVEFKTGKLRANKTLMPILSMIL